MSANFAEQVKNVTSSAEYKSGGEIKFEGGPGMEATPDLPTGGKPVEAEAAPKAESAVPTPKVVIGDKSFASVEDAVAYVAAQQELANKPKVEPVVAPAAPDWTEEAENLIFTDPKAAIKLIYEKAKQDTEENVFKRYDTMTAEQTKAAAAEKNYNNWKDSIVSSNKELQGFEGVRDYIIETSWNEIASLKPEAAAEVVATKTRALLKLQKDAALPQTVLPNGPAIVSGATGGPSASPMGATSAKPLSFIQQVRKHGKRAKS
jgi:hypothetical protein